MPPPRPHRVLICDDSAVVRSILRRILGRDPALEIVGEAANPYEARDRILALEPDVLTLDIEMPLMDGLSFLRIIMRERPMPVLILSTLSQRGTRIALEALQLGAIDVLGKPQNSRQLEDLAPLLIEKVKGAAQARRQRLRLYADAPEPVPAATATAPATPAPSRRFGRPENVERLPPLGTLHPQAVLLLGASTGGTEALRDVLISLPADVPPTLIVQHIPAYFSKAFADRLDGLCAMRVKEAAPGDRCQPGHVLVAPGDYHMLLRRDGRGYFVDLQQGPPIWHQRPAVDLLFKSAAQLAPHHAVAALLTGMGRDGAEGLLELRQKGARTFAQDEESCVVYGMPRVAHELGAAQAMVPLPRMAEVLHRALRP